MRVIGVDFSGASDGGKHIWIAEGEQEDHTLSVSLVYRASDIWGSRLNPCLELLVQAIGSKGPCAIGMDFPFGLPLALLENESWTEFIATFATRYPTAEAFKQDCWTRAGNRELRRKTDYETKTPFCVYNLRLYRQSFYGIRDVLVPLVTRETACVLPMQAAADGKPWILEICPASVLKQEGLYLSYKGRGTTLTESRGRIIEALLRSGHLVLADQARERAMQDAHGDALDCILAAIGVARALRDPSLLSCEADSIYAFEGRVLP